MRGEPNAQKEEKEEQGAQKLLFKHTATADIN